MLKALMKKQLLEMTSFIFLNKKDGKKRKLSSVLMYAILFIYCFGAMGSLFFMCADTLCKTYFDIGYGWLYFTLFGMTATGLGIFMGVFSIYSTIYQAKDNEFMLSIPIKPSHIIFVKLLGCYITTFIFEAIVLIPVYAVYIMNIEWNVLNIIFGILSLFLIPLFALTISCVLGLVIAFIASKLSKNIRTFITLLMSVAFLGVYFYFMSGANNYFSVFIENPDKIAGIGYIIYPLYLFGKGMNNEISSYLIFSGIALLFFAIIHIVLSRTFIKIATINKGSVVKKFEKKSLNLVSVEKSLLKREFIHLKSSAMYMLNCCMGSLLTIMAVVFLFISPNKITELLDMIGFEAEITGIMVCAVIAFISGMNDITAPSVSLEGKNIWIVQSLPVSAWKVLKAKIMLHMILTVIPAMIFAVATQFLFDMDIISRIMTFVCAFVFPLFEATFGLVLNLKMPNLNWTDEVVAVKQGANVLIAVFGGWAIVIGLGLLYFLLHKYIATTVFLLCSVLLVLAITFIMLIWIKKRGTVIFSRL